MTVANWDKALEINEDILLEAEPEELAQPAEEADEVEDLEAEVEAEPELEVFNVDPAWEEAAEPEKTSRQSRKQDLDPTQLYLMEIGASPPAYCGRRSSLCPLSPRG